MSKTNMTKGSYPSTYNKTCNCCKPCKYMLIIRVAKAPEHIVIEESCDFEHLNKTAKELRNSIDCDAEIYGLKTVIIKDEVCND